MALAGALQRRVKALKDESDDEITSEADDYQPPGPAETGRVDDEEGNISDESESGEDGAEDQVRSLQINLDPRTKATVYRRQILVRVESSKT